jgi:predicted permease
LGTDLTRLVFVRVHLDARGVGFAAVLTVAVGLGVGLVSAIRVAGPQILGALRQGAASAGRRRTAARTGLVTAQVALALVFLVASGLTLQSFRRTLDIPLGYRPDGLLAVKLTLDPIRVATQPTGVLWREVLDAVGDVPGVRSVALGDCSPLGMHCDGTTITPAGHVGAVHVLYLSASQGYFETLGTPLLRGRAFREGDDTSAVGAVIINQAAARAGWGDDDPLEVPVEGDARMRRVVGIVDDARYGDVELPPQPMVFVPFAHRARGVVFVRTDRESATLIAPIRQAIRRAGRGHAPGAVQTMTSRLRDATIRNRLSAQVFTGFAIAALLLAALGVYGTAALSVLQRAREFAIRRALGASTASLVGAVARQITWVVLAGGVAGIVGAIFVNQALTAILFDVRSVEPRILGASATLLLAAILAACVGPAARSLRIDPRDAMRAE